MMNCSECQDLLPALIDGILEEEQMNEMELHLSHCTACQTELAATRGMVERMLLDRQTVASVSLESAVMQRIEQEQPQRVRRQLRSRYLQRTGTVVAALVVLAAGIAYLNSPDDGRSAYAEEIAAARRQLQQARTISWTQTLIQRSRRQKGEAVWIDTASTRWYYKDPGLVRIEYLDRNKQVTRYEVTDHPNGKRLVCDLKAKEATLHESDKPQVEGPVDWSPLGWAVAELNGDLEWLGSKQMEGRKVNRFRTANINSGFTHPEHGEVGYNAEFWVDAESKQLVQVQRPGQDKMKELADFPGSLIPGFRDHDIRYGEQLDDPVFSLEPPADFQLKTKSDL